MPSRKQLQTLDKYVDVIHELLLDQLEGLRSSPDRQVNINRVIFVRMLGQMLYEAPKLHTGQVSIRLIEQKLNDFGSKGTVEHHHSRQLGGAALLALVDQSLITGATPTKDQVRNIALQYCQVHYTTIEENAALRKHQRRCSSEAAYRRANIELVEARDLFSKKGRHSEKWKEQMRAKYQPIVDAYNNPVHPDVDVPELPLVIN